MNCFWYTISKKNLREVMETGVFTVPVFVTKATPAALDRVYFNNFDAIFIITGVKKAPNEAELIKKHELSEACQAYLSGFYELSVEKLYDDFEIIDLEQLYYDGRYEEFISVAYDVSALLAQYKTKLKLAAINEKLSDEEYEELIEDSKGEAMAEVFGIILPSIFNQTSERKPAYKYNAVVLYIDGYEDEEDPGDALALMLCYSEEERGGHREYIPVAITSDDLIEKYEISCPDLQHLTECLFDEAILNFDYENALRPLIVTPEEHAAYFDGLVDHLCWGRTQTDGLGYVVFN